jgi:hypothetical protein
MMLAVVAVVVLAACSGRSTPDATPTAPLTTASTTTTVLPTTTLAPTTTLPGLPFGDDVIVIADCVPGWHNPPGRTDICVLDP